MPQINCISFSYDRCRMDGTYHKMPIIILQDDVICLHRKKYQVGPRLGNMPPTSIFRKFLKKTNRCRILHITNSFIEACYKLRKSDIFCFFSQYIIGEFCCSMFLSFFKTRHHSVFTCRQFESQIQKLVQFIFSPSYFHPYCL